MDVKFSLVLCVSLLLADCPCGAPVLMRDAIASFLVWRVGTGILRTAGLQRIGMQKAGGS